MIPRRAVPSGSVRRRRRILTGVLGVLLLLGLLAAGWLLVGLSDAAHDVHARAGAAGRELTRVKDELERGNVSAADRRLSAADTHLAAADAAAARRQVRIARRLPLAGPVVDDLDHLLAAGHAITIVAREALVLHRDVRWGSSLFVDGRFDLARLDRGSRVAARLTAALADARRELEAVHGGGLAPAAVTEARVAGLRQVAELQRGVGRAASVATALPEAVGGRGPRTYLLVVLGPTEPRPFGGEPVSISILRVDNGRMTVEEPPANRAAGFADLVAAATSASWQTSAEQLCQAYAAQFHAPARPASSRSIRSRSPSCCGSPGRSMRHRWGG